MCVSFLLLSYNHRPRPFFGHPVSTAISIGVIQHDDRDPHYPETVITMGAENTQWVNEKYARDFTIELNSITTHLTDVGQFYSLLPDFEMLKKKMTPFVALMSSLMTYDILILKTCE